MQTAARPPLHVAGSRLRDLLEVRIPESAVDAGPCGDLAKSVTLELPDLGDGAEMPTGGAGDIAAAIHGLLTERGFVS